MNEANKEIEQELGKAGKDISGGNQETTPSGGAEKFTVKQAIENYITDVNNSIFHGQTTRSLVTAVVTMMACAFFCPELSVAAT